MKTYVLKLNSYPLGSHGISMACDLVKAMNTPGKWVKEDGKVYAKSDFAQKTYAEMQDGTIVVMMHVIARNDSSNSGTREWVQNVGHIKVRE